LTTAITIPASTNTTMAICIHTQVGDIAHMIPRTDGSG
jgi:hypothetical protein